MLKIFHQRSEFVTSLLPDLTSDADEIWQLGEAKNASHKLTGKRKQTDNYDGYNLAI